MSEQDQVKRFCSVLIREESEQGVVYTPAVYSNMAKRIIWVSQFSNRNPEEAAKLSFIISENLEEDFRKYLDTGKRDKELIYILDEIGTFETEDEDKKEAQNRQNTLN